MRWLRIVIIALPLLGTGMDSRAATLNLAVGGEVTPLEITHCRADPYQSGQLAIEAEITAVGSFRGRSAMVLLAKVSGAGSDHVDLYLIDPSEELRTMPPLAAVNRITMDHAALYSRRTAEVNAEFEPEKLLKLSADEMRGKLDEQVARLDALEEEMKAIQPPHVRSFGAITVEGSTIHFRGSDTRIIDGELVGALAQVEGELRLTALCER